MSKTGNKTGELVLEHQVGNRDTQWNNQNGQDSGKKKAECYFETTKRGTLTWLQLLPIKWTRNVKGTSNNK